MDLSELVPVRSNQENYQKELCDAGGWTFFLNWGRWEQKGGDFLMEGIIPLPMHHEVLISDLDRFQKVPRCVNFKKHAKAWNQKKKKKKKKEPSLWGVGGFRSL